jgi:Ca2+-binding RTX toxin-like protein
MTLSTPFRFMLYGTIVLILGSVLTAIAAANTVPFTRVTDQSNSVDINDLKPYACAGISLTNLVSGSGTLTGTPGNDLILGSSGADMIDGLGGNDCIIGGGGDDQINGGDGNDVCISSTGNDIFANCEVEK